MDCTQHTDPLKLVREGTSQEQRSNVALDPVYAPVDERLPEHSMVFARAFAQYLNYYDSSNTALGDWQAFFANDVSVQLAVVAVQDVASYKAQIKSYLDFLNNRDHQANDTALKQQLGYLFSSIGSLAKQIDTLNQSLPAGLSLRATLFSLIQTQLAPGLSRLIGYYKADVAKPETQQLITDAHPEGSILGKPTRSFKSVFEQGLSTSWLTNPAITTWAAYTAAIPEDLSGFGSASDVFDPINHIATHNLFTAVLDQFLKAYARIVVEAKAALANTFTQQDDHEPHYTLFLAFLRLREYARQETNTLTKRHLDFYYRDVLRLREKPAEPAHAHILLELAKHVETHLLPQGELVKAGKDSTGKNVFFANDRDVVINQASVSSLKTVYRHGNEAVGDEPSTQQRQNNRLYASPVANSNDGLGAPLTASNQSWHPFFNKLYRNGRLESIQMPKAEIGFAIASHYLWMAEGERTITVEFAIDKLSDATPVDLTATVTCSLTGEKGWIDKAPTRFTFDRLAKTLSLVVQLTGADPAVTPYRAKTHGLGLTTSLPVLIVRLNQQDELAYGYPQFGNINVQKIDLRVDVTGVRTLGVSNDFGPVDTSKPFQPFGAQPVANSSLTVGSSEVFQKNGVDATLKIAWLNPPAFYKSTAPGVISTEPTIAKSKLIDGQWQSLGGTETLTSATSFSFTSNPAGRYVEFSPSESYTSASKRGYVRLTLTADLGFNRYQIDLGNYLTNQAPKPTSHPGLPVLGPTIKELTIDYTATQRIPLNTSNPADFTNRGGAFFHITPFGFAEQHPYLKQQSQSVDDRTIYLVPPFNHRSQQTSELISHEAEFYIGLTNLQPPQSLALLFEVADGTADPQTVKPISHLHWSYLSQNEWVSFTQDAVDDTTGGLIRSGIVTLAVPRDATHTNTLLPVGMNWIRVAVAEKSEAICRLLSVAAQALRTTFTDQLNDPAFLNTVLPAGTISKLDQPDAAVKQVAQPFPAFGGRGREESDAFYTRISERLRHKDRAIALWDYERLILEAFPQIYRVKCLNHTHYEPGVYRELAAGHVTIVTIPNQRVQNLRDPLRPYTSLGLLAEIDAFITRRLSCFVKLHVRNPEFETVKVSLNVRFYPGFDETFYKRTLKEALVRFLSPWAFQGGESPTFGGKIYKSVLINFIEDQPYVDYLTDVRLIHTLASGHSAEGSEEIEGSKAISILVSVPVDEHDITLIKPAESESPAGQCLCEA